MSSQEHLVLTSLLTLEQLLLVMGMQGLLEQQLKLWLPDDRQHVHCSAGSLPAHGDKAGEEDEEELGQL